MRAGLAACARRWSRRCSEVGGLGGGHDEALADAQGQGLEVRGAQLLEQALVAGEDDGEDGAGVEVGGGEHDHHRLASLGKHRQRVGGGAESAIPGRCALRLCRRGAAPLPGHASSTTIHAPRIIPPLGPDRDSTG